MDNTCKKCAHYEEGMVFELCKHPKSEYSVAGRSDFHTISHMREPWSACTPDAVLMKRKV